MQHLFGWPSVYPTGAHSIDWTSGLPNPQVQLSVVLTQL
jgi:hypothetical protein